MEIDLQRCWDCPMLLSSVLPFLLGCALATGAGAWLAARARSWLRAVGVIIALPPALIQLTMILAVSGNGVRVTDLTVWYGWDALIILGLVTVALPAAVWHATWTVTRRAT
jgi:hypothetical protein